MICRSFLLKIDKKVNGLLLGNPKQTISYRIGVLSENGNKVAILISFVLDCFDYGHCKRAIDDKDQNGKDE